jgi:hypothetical protein
VTSGISVWWSTVTGASSTVPPCAGDATTWDAGYGGCSTYWNFGSNANFCRSHSSGGLNASEVCPECGSCATTTTPSSYVVGGTFIAAATTTPPHTSYSLATEVTAGTAGTFYIICWAHLPETAADFALHIGAFTLNGPLTQSFNCPMTQQCVVNLAGTGLHVGTSATHVGGRTNMVRVISYISYNSMYDINYNSSCSLPLCRGDAATWDAGYGGCSTYLVDATVLSTDTGNWFNCASHSSGGLSASEGARSAVRA